MDLERKNQRHVSSGLDGEVVKLAPSEYSGSLPQSSQSDFPDRPGRCDGVVALHADVDAVATRLFLFHGDRLQCRRGCSSCCVDDLSVFEVEAHEIRVHNAPLLMVGVPHATGACAFLDHDGACRIYAERPYVCRTQGLPLRWMDDEPGMEAGLSSSVELRDICPLSEAGNPVELLREEDCFTLGPAEERLARIQCATEHPSGRVLLRSLFAQVAVP